MLKSIVDDIIDDLLDIIKTIQSVNGTLYEEYRKSKDLDIVVKKIAAIIVQLDRE